MDCKTSEDFVNNNNKNNGCIKKLKNDFDESNEEDNHILTKLLAYYNIKFNSRIKWEYVLLMGFLHLVSLYALLTLESPLKHPQTFIWGKFESFINFRLVKQTFFV
jgi:hypothetical protein